MCMGYHCPISFQIIVAITVELRYQMLQEQNLTLNCEIQVNNGQTVHVQEILTYNPAATLTEFQCDPVNHTMYTVFIGAQNVKALGFKRR